MGRCSRLLVPAWPTGLGTPRCGSGRTSRHGRRRQPRPRQRDLRCEPCDTAACRVRSPAHLRYGHRSELLKPNWALTWPRSICWALDPGYPVETAPAIVALDSPEASAADFSRPGHVVWMEAGAGGVLRRPWTAEAAVDSPSLAGPPAVGTVCEVVSEERAVEPARGEELARFAAKRELPLISIADLITYRLRRASRGSGTTH
jgi:hypothetical protein